MSNTFKQKSTLFLAICPPKDDRKWLHCSCKILFIVTRTFEEGFHSDNDLCFCPCTFWISFLQIIHWTKTFKYFTGSCVSFYNKGSFSIAKLKTDSYKAEFEFNSKMNYKIIIILFIPTVIQSLGRLAC